MFKGLLLASLLLSTSAMAQEQQKEKDSTLDKAGRIASQPIRDIGIAKTKTPEVLERALVSPYAVPAKGCTAIKSALVELNAALGPDFGTGREVNVDRFGDLAEAGGSAVVNSLIPFRGLVREVSGAGPAERRRDAAVAAGLARRGYLRGVAGSRKCSIPA